MRKRTREETNQNINSAVSLEFMYRDLLQEQANKRAKLEFNMTGLTLLHQAVINGNADEVNQLLDQGHPLHLKTKNNEKENGVFTQNIQYPNMTPLELAQKLKENTSNHDEVDKYNKIISLLQTRQELLNLQIQSFVKNGNLKGVKGFHQLGAQLDLNINNYDLFHCAIYYGHLEILKYLHENGIDINKPDSNGHTPATLAVIKGRLNIFQFYIEKGLTQLDSKDDKDKSHFDYATLYGQLEILKYLKEKTRNNDERAECDAAIDYLQKKQNLQIQNFVKNGNLDGVKSAHQLGAQLDLNINNYDLFHCAIYYGHLEILKYLYENGIDINKPASNGFTPAEIAVRRGHSSILSFLNQNSLNINTQYPPTLMHLNPEQENASNSTFDRS